MRYTKAVKDEAFNFYLKGLKSKEIGKLLDLNFRTVQEFMRVDEWKAQRELETVRNEKRIIRKYLKSEREKAAAKAAKSQKAEI